MVDTLFIFLPVLSKHRFLWINIVSYKTTKTRMVALFLSSNYKEYFERIVYIKVKVSHLYCLDNNNNRQYMRTNTLIKENGLILILYICRYEITPKRVHKVKTAENYGIDELTSGDETDDDECPRKRVPDWAQGRNILVLKLIVCMDGCASFLAIIN